ncbi:formate/nitrite transporter family protein [Actibacterium sp. 188UL27-1]|uniref:formate/nitrite transporter family protein n=1 Tax=Actibacterium sp. 188UL27-1 TaxID=2786961 RepID=UPI00195CCFC9|nr:formate/nitrite transporter family protein [Actibacterium sp. 188UL27-1]MBM7070066.1 formate/nitrite transporter family protein [Actibacterium sp. 188UL27-1]
MTKIKDDTGATRQEAVADEQSMQEATKLSPRLIYEVIRRDGEEELERPLSSLVWSGIAAGILISFSVLGEAIFRTYLPETPSSYLIENLGYSLGFLLVILGRMQLFTENTITTVLPLMFAPSRRLLSDVCRLWLIVLSANVVGAFAIATVFAHTSAIPVELMPALVSLSEHAVGMPAGESFMRAIPAGILIAAIVWMLPQAEDASFFVILVSTWLIAAGDFTHVVAGSVEMALLSVRGDLGFYDAVFGFFIPVLAGNVVGGTAIFTLMAWGQVRNEVEDAGTT